MGARLEICTLRDTVAAHLTPESRSSFKQALEALPQLSSGADRKLLELLLSRVRSSVHLQLACFQATPPPAVKTQDPLARVGSGGPRRLARAIPLAPSAPLLAPRVACSVAAGALLWWHLCHQAWELPLTPLPEQLPDFRSDQRAAGKELEELETWHRLPTGRWVSLQAPPGLRVSGPRLGPLLQLRPSLVWQLPEKRGRR
ncbi:hypothetical protein J1605_004611 [Eschrichtius robustus]|uniref:Exocyst complex component EXOC2/Sec5 N-terminal domain-containing protein n=1 Tax=Eschrichtius robustus TaxID=9764 RepID=A0AB34HEH3_ESCRO|nr:hypothetical protein J1605_004611 [Eschrichtius robustus]